MSRPCRTLLGFDYGTKRIGVAVGQSLTCTSTPLETLQPISDAPDWNAIAGLIETWNPDCLVVGLPLNMDGSESDMTQAARGFANSLEGRYHLHVECVDERLSSVEAEQILKNQRQGKKANWKKDKKMIDQVAAQLILNTYFSLHQIQ